MKRVKVLVSGAILSSLMATSLMAQTTGPVNVNSITNPGICDGSGSGRPSANGKQKGYGPGNGTGNQGTRPQDGTGYGSKNQHPTGTMGNTSGLSRGQGSSRQGGGSGGRRNNR
jgi:hypothetical protein